MRRFLAWLRGSTTDEERIAEHLIRLSAYPSCWIIGDSDLVLRVYPSGVSCYKARVVRHSRADEEGA